MRLNSCSWICAALLSVAQFVTNGAAAQVDALPSAPGVAEPPAAPVVPKIRLQEALSRALERNPRSAVAMADLRRAEALVTQARSNFLPSLTGNATYTRLDDDRALNGRVLQNANQLAANLNLNLPLLAPQRWVQKRQADDNAAASKLDSSEVRRQLAISTAHAYLAVMAQHRVIEVGRRALQNANAHYSYAHTRNEGGIGNQLDDTRAQQEVATSQATLEQSLAALVQAQEALGVLVGADHPLDVEDDTSLPEVPSGADLDAIERRSDVLASQSRVRLSQRVVKGKWADYAPTLGANFVPFYTNPPTPTLPRLGWSAQIILSVPLLDSGLRIGAAREREAALESSRAQLEGVVRSAKSDVRVSLSNVERADASLAAAARAAKLSVEALEMANLAYRAGATTNLEVIDAERRARDAQTSAVIAEDTARRARLDLLAATGRLP